MDLLIHPTYFPNVITCAHMAKADRVIFEKHDNYQKQTYRNRTHILGANGKLALTIPVVYSQKQRQLYKDIRIANTEAWQAHHWKSLLSAYGASPFYEYYKDELYPLFHNSQAFLFDFNILCLDVIKDCLQWDLPYEFTTEFEKESTLDDQREFVNARKEKRLDQDTYTQVFSDKFGFTHNLSILDLLFNEGPNALTYLSA